jgi:hypothetical protein
MIRPGKLRVINQNKKIRRGVVCVVSRYVYYAFFC